MPTARELLEQAEALMRRDRMAAVAADDDFPVLTDAVDDAPGEAPAIGARPATETAATAPAVEPTPASAAATEPVAPESDVAVIEAPAANGHAAAQAADATPEAAP